LSKRKGRARKGSASISLIGEGILPIFQNLKGGETMKKRVWAFLLVLVFFGFSLSGCYYFSARNQMKTAEGLISDLKAQGGEKLVPYEYGSAENFLEVARREFDQNDFKSAKQFADRSRAAGEQGLVEVKKKK
jgi:hypothetical protein